jgi:hypothetical protein
VQWLSEQDPTGALTIAVHLALLTSSEAERAQSPQLQQLWEGAFPALAALNKPPCKFALNMAQVLRNKEAGDKFRDEIANLLQKAGKNVDTEVYHWTPFGRRFIDIEVSSNGKVVGGIETKVGSSPYTPLQRLKDWWLNWHDGYKVNVVRKP